MENIHFGLLIAVVLVSAHTLQLLDSQLCHEDSDCSPEQCCLKKPSHVIMSKREATQGRCRNYLTLDNNCAGAFRFWGSCGCAPDLYCHYYPEPFQTVGKRRSLTEKDKRKMLAPGKYLCKPVSEKAVSN